MNTVGLTGVKQPNNRQPITKTKHIVLFTEH